MAEISLRLMRQGLGRRFFARYLLMVFALCLGGALFGALSAFGGSLLVESADVNEILPEVVERTLGSLVVGLVGALMGGMAGLVEGLILGFPLATVLGLFGTGDDRR